MYSIWVKPDFNVEATYTPARLLEVIDWLTDHSDLQHYTGDLRKHRDVDGHIDLQASEYVSFRMVDHEQTLFDWLYLSDCQIIIRVDDCWRDEEKPVIKCNFYGANLKAIALMFALSFKGT